MIDMFSDKKEAREGAMRRSGEALVAQEEFALW
jgi:hypothetical protein